MKLAVMLLRKTVWKKGEDLQLGDSIISTIDGIYLAYRACADGKQRPYTEGTEIHRKEQ